MKSRANRGNDNDDGIDFVLHSTFIDDVQMHMQYVQSSAVALYASYVYT